MKWIIVSIEEVGPRIYSFRNRILKLVSLLKREYIDRRNDHFIK